MVAFTSVAATPIRNMLHDLGHPQKPNIIYSDNKSSVTIANNTATQRRSKAKDMIFHWIIDRIEQGQFILTWVVPVRLRIIQNTSNFSCCYHAIDSDVTTPADSIAQPRNQTCRRLGYLKSKQSQ